MKIGKKEFALLTLFFNSSIWAASFIEMENIIENVNQTFTNYYAPKEWKEKIIAWDLPAEITKLRAFATSETPERFQQGLKEFFRSMRDYHTSIRFANNAVSWLPLSIKYIDNKFYVAYIDPTISNSMLKVGDEITTFGGRDITEVAIELMGVNNPSLTDWSIAAKRLTKRLGTAGDAVEKGSILIEGKRSNEAVFAQLIWLHNENLIKKKQDNKNHSISPRNYKNGLSLEIKTMLDNIIDDIEKRSHYLPYADSLRLLPEENSKDPLALGKKESYLPPLSSKEVWRAEKDNFFQANIYINENNKLIGFIRIPSYSPDKSLGTPEQFVEKFGQIITFMEDKTDLLVIDQLNNPGGSVFYLYTLASMLTNKPLKNPRHQFMIDSKDIFEAHELLKQCDQLLALPSFVNIPLGTVHGYPIDKLFLMHMRSYYQFIIEQGQAGKTLTDPYFLHGVDYIQPHPQVRYTKKIIILTNELDFSGGDFFPAIFQDNKRALILGTTTAGAGGYVLTVKNRNRANILQYSYTGSLAFRADGTPLENNGVSPDIQYQISSADLAQGFRSFATKISSTINDLLQGS